MIKRIVCGLVLTGVCVVGLAGCGGGNEPKAQNTGQELQPRPAPAGPNEKGGGQKPGAGVQ
jgi:hypothetical protein